MITLKCCPHCGSFDYTYTGIDDGGGDYGSALCDNYECNLCGYCWEEGCMEYDDDDDQQPIDDLTNTDSIEPLYKSTHSPDGGGDYRDEIPF